eukprot:5045646-Pyramimonas_sp.AAC.1
MSTGAPTAQPATRSTTSRPSRTFSTAGWSGARRAQRSSCGAQSLMPRGAVASGTRPCHETHDGGIGPVRCASRPAATELTSSSCANALRGTGPR